MLQGEQPDDYNARVFYYNQNKNSILDTNFREALSDRIFITHAGGSNGSHQNLPLKDWSIFPHFNLSSTIYQYVANSNDPTLKGNMIIVGNSSEAGEPAYSLQASNVLSVTTMGRGNFLPSRIINNQGEYELAQFDFIHEGGELSPKDASEVYIAGGVASMLWAELKDNAGNYDKKMVKSVMLSAADKYHFPKITYDGVNHGEDITTKLFTAERTDDRGHGEINAYQSLLMTQAHLFNQPDRVFQPHKVQKNELLTMGIDKMMYESNQGVKECGFSLNRHGMSGYKLPNKTTFSAGSEIYSSYPKADFIHVTDKLSEEHNQKLYAQSLNLLDNELYIKNFNNETTWQVTLPELDHNRLLAYSGCWDALCSIFLPNIQNPPNTDPNIPPGSFPNPDNTPPTAYVTPDQRDDINNNLQTFLNGGKQWFRLADRNDRGDRFRTCDLIVQYFPLVIDDQGNASVSDEGLLLWSIREPSYDPNDEFRRHLLRDYTKFAQDDSDQNGKTDIVSGNPLLSSEYLHSPNYNFHFIVHNGSIYILQKDANDNFTNIIWQKNYLSESTEATNVVISESSEVYSKMNLVKASDNSIIEEDLGRNCLLPEEDGEYRFLIDDNGIGKMVSKNSDLVWFSFVNDNEILCNYIGHELSSNQKLKENQYILSNDKKIKSVLEKNESGLSMLRIYEKENGKYTNLIMENAL